MEFDNWRKFCFWSYLKVGKIKIKIDDGILQNATFVGFWKKFRRTKLLEVAILWRFERCMALLRRPLVLQEKNIKKFREIKHKGYKEKWWWFLSSSSGGIMFFSEISQMTAKFAKVTENLLKYSIWYTHYLKNKISKLNMNSFISLCSNCQRRSK